MFLRSPKFTFAAIGALALGIGTNVAIFSVVNAVLLQPLHVPDPDRVVAFSVDATSDRAYASDIKFNLWREQTSVFEQQSAYHTGTLDLTGLDQPQKLNAIYVTAEYFHLFGLPLAQGRIFSTEEELPNGPHAVLLSNDFWRKSLGGNPSLLGKTLLLGGEIHEVIGVMASSVRTDMIKQPDVWLPFPIDPNSTAQVHYFQAAGRLKPGITVAMANAQLKITTQEFWRKYPDSISTRRGDVLAVQRLQDVLVKNIRSSLLTLWAAVGLVLLIACANVANLLLVRATARQREIAIRVALGASPARIVRQLLTESVLLATAGALLGLALGIAGIRALLSLNAVILPRIGVNGANLPVDAHVVLFVMITALVTGILFGLVPALQASRLDVNSHLKESAGRTGSGLRQNKTRSLLVIGELSLSLLLLIGAALLIRTLVSLRSVNPGFDSQNIVAAEVSLDPKLAKTATKDQIIQDVLRRLSNTAGWSAPRSPISCLSVAISTACP
jgi:predicted permease